MSARVFEMEATALALGSMQLTPEQLAAIDRVRKRCDKPGARAALSPLERADREEAVAGWLARRGLRRVTAEELAETPLTVEDLDLLAGALGPDQLEYALRSIGAGQRTRGLASEVEIAASRIHALVAAIKGFTYMDQSRVPKPVAIALPSCSGPGSWVRRSRAVRPGASTVTSNRSCSGADALTPSRSSSAR